MIVNKSGQSIGLLLSQARGDEVVRESKMGIDDEELFRSAGRGAGLESNLDGETDTVRGAD